MPAETLGDMITDVREELFIFSTTLAFRDGDAADARNSESPVASVSITTQINRAIDDTIIRTGFTLDSAAVAFTAGTREVALPTSFLDVVSVSYGGVRLLKTSIPSLDARRPLWRASANGAPKEFYVNGTTKIGFDVPPNTSANATVYAVQDVTALTGKGSTLPYLPTVFHWLIPVRAAIFCAGMDAGNPKAADRAAALLMRWKEGIEDLKALMQARMGVDLASGVSIRVPDK